MIGLVVHHLATSVGQQDEIGPGDYFSVAFLLMAVIVAAWLVVHGVLEVVRLGNLPVGKKSDCAFAKYRYKNRVYVASVRRWVVVRSFCGNNRNGQQQ